jgi:hypothetical protein
MDITVTKEWIEQEIGKLEWELEKAEKTKALATIKLENARTDYSRAAANHNAAMDTVETTAGLIRYFRKELAYITEGVQA